MYRVVHLDQGENPDHRGYYRKMFGEKLIGDRCEACVRCDSEYSGGRGISCHDTCEVFQQWKKECQNIGMSRVRQ